MKRRTAPPAQRNRRILNQQEAMRRLHRRNELIRLAPEDDPKLLALISLPLQPTSEPAVD